MPPNLKIITAGEAYAKDVWRLLHALAEYEQKLDHFHLTIWQLRAALWRQHRVAKALLARIDEKSVGIAVCYPTFPTFSGHPALFIEDLFVLPAYQRQGIGTALMQACGELAEEMGLRSLRWWALDWNDSAMAFYEQVGAKCLDRCVVHEVATSRLLHPEDEAEASVEPAD